MALNQSKAKRFISNFVGASASVAVVTAVASVTIAIEARFINVDVFENRAFYQLEVIENIIVDGSGSLPSSDVEPSAPATVQLRVENQWDNFVIQLMYGLNQGSIEPLRSNQAYTLTIELEDTLGWRTLDTYTFNTRPRTNALITSIEETTTPLSNTTAFDIRFITQNGFSEAESWEVALTYGSVSDTRITSVGEQNLVWSNLPHQNTDVHVGIYATINGERKLIHETTQSTTPYVDAAIDLRFPTIGTLQITPTFNNLELNATYSIELINSQQVSQIFDLSSEGLRIDNLVAEQTYQLKWMLKTEDQREFVILEKALTPISQPFFVLSIQPAFNGVTFELTIDRIPTLNSIYLSIGEWNEASAHAFTLINENNDVSYFELFLQTGIPLGSSLALTLVQASPYDYPITFYSFNFQGGISR